MNDAAVEPAVEPSPYPYAALLQALNAPSFDALAELAERRASCGLPRGAVDTVLDGRGNPIAMRVRRYLSDAEAGTDLRVQDLIDAIETERDAAERDQLGARLDVARRLQPVAARWHIENELRRLPPAPTPRNAPAAPERPAAAVSREFRATVVGEASFDTTVRSLNLEHAQVQRDRRDFEIARFDARQEALVRRLDVPSTDDDADVQRLRLESRLVAWNAAHPELAAELDA